MDIQALQITAKEAQIAATKSEKTLMEAQKAIAEAKYADGGDAPSPLLQMQVEALAEKLAMLEADLATLKGE